MYCVTLEVQMAVRGWVPPGTRRSQQCSKLNVLVDVPQYGHERELVRDRVE